MNPDSKEEGINVIHHSSFFDTPSIKSKVFQSFNLKKNANPFTEENPVYSKGFLLKRSLSSHNPKKRHFFLAEDGIYYGKDVNTNSVNKYMCYENTRVLFETPADVFDKKKAFKECKYVMKFFRNYHIAEIGTDDWDIYEYWKEFLAYKCIQHTFHEEFEVKKMIGKGSFAKVYYAVKKENKKAYAIKAFNKDVLSSQTSGKESLINEVNLMKRLDNTNILKIYEIYETIHSIYLVIDLLEGGELLKRVKESPKLTHNDIAKLMYNLIKALEHIHRRKIIHRDLKPENLLLKSKNNMVDIVIADFGLATRFDIPVSEIFFKRCGTPGFVAPEVLNYKDESVGFYDDKCDMFSAGSIFFVLITGKKLFPGDNCAQVLRDNKNCVIDYSSDLLKKAPNSAIDLLKKLLFVLPQGRISATKALTHKYFTDHNVGPEQNNKYMITKLSTENMINMKTIQMNLTEYVNDFTPTSENKQDSINILIRKPLLNGKVETITKLGTGMFNSGLIDVSPKKNVASKFSQANEIPACIGGFSDIVGGMNVSTGLHGSSGIGGVDFSPKKHKGSFGNELHKQALMNSHNRKESQVKIKNNEMVPEENCHVLRDWEGKKGGINKKTSAFERK